MKRVFFIAGASGKGGPPTALRRKQPACHNKKLFSIFRSPDRPMQTKQDHLSGNPGRHIEKKHPLFDKISAPIQNISTTKIKIFHKNQKSTVRMVITPEYKQKKGEEFITGVYMS